MPCRAREITSCRAREITSCRARGITSCGAREFMPCRARVVMSCRARVVMSCRARGITSCRGVRQPRNFGTRNTRQADSGNWEYGNAGEPYHGGGGDRVRRRSRRLVLPGSTRRRLRCRANARHPGPGHHDDGRRPRYADLRPGPRHRAGHQHGERQKPGGRADHAGLLHPRAGGEARATSCSRSIRGRIRRRSTWRWRTG